jgi:hypothetical protein
VEQEHTVELNEPTEALTDEELSIVHGGGFLTQLVSILSTGESGHGGRGMSSGNV